MALVCLAGSVRAEARVLVLSPVEEGPRPTLVEALRLQLRGTAGVTQSAAVFPALPASGRVTLATELVALEHVDFAIWLESVGLRDGKRLFALYVVGGQSGRAVLEVVRLPAESDGPDVDRTLGLKASEIIEAALSPAVLLSPQQKRDIARRPLSDPRLIAVDERRLALELGGALHAAAQRDTQVALALGLSWLFALQPLELDARLTGQLASDAVIAVPHRHVQLSESFVGAGLGLRSTGTVQLGAKLGFGLRLLGAEGFSEEARTGASRVVVPSLSVGPELRIKLGSRIRFGAEIAGEWLAIRQRFNVDGVTVADLGRFRGNAQLSLAFLML